MFRFSEKRNPLPFLLLMIKEQRTPLISAVVSIEASTLSACGISRFVCFVSPLFMSPESEAHCLMQSGEERW